MHTRARVHNVIQLAQLSHEPSHLMEGKDRSVATGESAHIYTHTSAGEEPLTFNGIM